MSLRTCTVMIQANGSGLTVYAVMRGPVSKHGDTFYAHKADVLATYKVGRGERADYAAMTARHATPECPAVKWQRS